MSPSAGARGPRPRPRTRRGAPPSTARQCGRLDRPRDATASPSDRRKWGRRPEPMRIDRTVVAVFLVGGRSGRRALWTRRSRPDHPKRAGCDGSGHGSPRPPPSRPVRHRRGRRDSPGTAAGRGAAPSRWLPGPGPQARANSVSCDAGARPPRPRARRFRPLCTARRHWPTPPARPDGPAPRARAAPAQARRTRHPALGTRHAPTPPVLPDGPASGVRRPASGVRRPAQPPVQASSTGAVATRTLSIAQYQLFPALKSRKAAFAEVAPAGTGQESRTRRFSWSLPRLSLPEVAPL